MSRLLSILAVLLVSLTLLRFTTGCQTMGELAEIGATIAAETGAIKTNEAESITRGVRALGKSYEDITAEQEHFIGRAVSAKILEKYQVLDKPALNNYLNLLGQTLSSFSDRPETFAGYHFLSLDSHEINAFAAPGGFIFITKGMLQLCSNEDELAAVLAHEISHVSNQHGLKTIKKSRFTQALAIIASESARHGDIKELEGMTDSLEGAIDDVLDTLVVNGYSRAQEAEADLGAVLITSRSGYNPHALRTMLTTMGQELKPHRRDFVRTHPPVTVRIKSVNSQLSQLPVTDNTTATQARFQKAMAL